MHRGLLFAFTVLVAIIASTASAVRPLASSSSSSSSARGIVVLEAPTQDEVPLVSVIIPTHDRPEFLAQALRHIKRQDYGNVEVVIVDDSEEAVPIQVEGMNINFIRLTERKSIGEKRNIAVANAKGKVVVHWDDDDYFRPHRLSEQVAPILNGEVEMTVLEHHFYYVATTRTFYTIKRPASWGPHFGTFAYARSIFEAGVRYPDNSLAEDYSFAELALVQGFQIRVLSNTDGKHIYVRHENTWKFDLEEYGAQVTEVEKPEFVSEEDHEFLLNIKAVVSHVLPLNNFVSSVTQWNRDELHPQEDMGKSTPKYPHYKPKKDDGLSTGAKVGIGVGVAGGVVLIVVVGIGAYFFFQWQKRRYPGYARINTDI